MATRAAAKKTKKPTKAAKATKATRTAPAKKATKAAAAKSVRRIAVSGSQSGLGLAIRKRLEAGGAKVIGIDLPGKGAEVDADLSTPEGRKQAVKGVLKHCNGRLDGVVANAGVDAKDAELVFNVNFHGVVDLLEGLRPALAASGRAAAVVTASHAMMVTPGIRAAAVDALLARHDKRAALFAGRGPGAAYAVSKLAVARWVRAQAARPEWAGSGISLNAVCPGAIQTPLLEKDLADKIKGPIIRAVPKPLGEIAQAEDLAGIFEFLLAPEARFIVGQMIVSDGGVESIWRETDWPAPWAISTPRFLLKLFGKR